MRIKYTIPKETVHTDSVTSVAWVSADHVLSASDDHTVIKWNLLNGEESVLCKLPQELFPTDLCQLILSNPGGKNVSAADVFAITSTDGKFYIVSQAGRIEKSVQAHKGAILSGKWNHDGTAFLTCGEDGQLKLWSRSGMLRSTIAQLPLCVYAVAWGPESDQILYTQGRSLMIKPLQPSGKEGSWKAHDGIVLKADWNKVSNLIVSGGEDCRYKIWDSFGRPLYSSSPFDYPVTSVSWSPVGDLFAVGSFNSIALCDKSGWSHALEKPTTGSIFSIAWSGDGMQFAAACADGQVILAHCVEKRLEWCEFEVTLVSRKTVEVKNVVNDAHDKLEMKDRVIKIGLDFNYLVIVTSAQCHIYSTNNFNTPAIFDLREGAISYIQQADKHFLLVDRSGVHIYSYEGKHVSSPKLPNTVQASTLTEKVTSISSEVLAIRDSKDEKVVFLFDALSGKPIGGGQPVTHKLEVVEVCVNHCNSSERFLAVLDKNHDLYLTPIRTLGSNYKLHKLSSMVHSVQWNTTVNMICALQDSKMLVWYYPSVLFVDKDVMPLTVFEKDSSDLGKYPELCSFRESAIKLRRTDGSRISVAISPYPCILNHLAMNSKWNEALTLCRFTKDKSLWACLAAMSLKVKDLNIAEIAYAAVGQAGKVEHLNHIKGISSKVVRSAEMALFCGNSSEAESIFLQNSQIYRAIQLNMDLFRWEKALDLAVKHKTHLDTVLGFRQVYLQRSHKPETSNKFKQYSQGVNVNWDNIRSKIEADLEN